MKKIFETETFTSFRFFYIQQFFENKEKRQFLYLPFELVILTR